MKNTATSFGIAARIWFFTALFLSLGYGEIMLYTHSVSNAGFVTMFFMFAFIGSFPAFIIIWIVAAILRKKNLAWRAGFLGLMCCCLLITLPYGLLFEVLNLNNLLFKSFSNKRDNIVLGTLINSAFIFLPSLIALFISLRPAWGCFNSTAGYIPSYNTVFFRLFFHTSKTNHIMKTIEPYEPVAPHSNRLLIKGLITGGLILVMLIPTIFIMNLVAEREDRQKEAVLDISSKWASAQTLSGPYLVVTYTDSVMSGNGTMGPLRSKLILLAGDLMVSGDIIPEVRTRSIYKALLYRARLAFKGNFKPTFPADINTANIDYTSAKLCFNLSDFKGIEEDLYITVNGKRMQLMAGIPVNDFGPKGLSVPITLTAEQLSSGIDFNMQLKLRGSEQLHFIPTAGSGNFNIRSAWSSPSFDGDVLPGDRAVNQDGFQASWKFNQANLPYGTVIKQQTIGKIENAFGVSLVQPADQYDKTMRSVKYAILFIGLTFAFFFIIEIMQKKPFHPVQYVLVGLALVIFYTLLLSISEYIVFDYAYLLSAFAVVLLISLYAKGHFQSWRTAGIFFGLLSFLYGFIFILIRLEDTALLIGSIGLFIVLAIVMFVSRRINWYGQPSSPSVHTLSSDPK